jgi:hypothetical protein
MKQIISGLLVLGAFASSTVFASAKCPNGTQTIKVCDSTPRAGDQEVASGVLDSIAICDRDGKAVLAMEKSGQTKDALAKVSVKMGGTSYTVSAGGVEFVLSMTTGTAPAPTKPAKLTVNFKKAGISASASYTCKK